MDRRVAHDCLKDLAEEWEENLRGASSVLHCLAGAVMMGEEDRLAQHCTSFSRAALVRLKQIDKVAASMKVQ